MTTIAFRDGVMAADSAIFMGDRRVGDAVKIVRIDGDLLGVAGSSDCRALYDLLNEYPFPSAEQIAALKCDFSAIFAHSADDVTYMTCDWINGQWLGQAIKVQGAYQMGIAIGSGSAYATGAMYVGAGAVDAVAAACKFDAWSGQPIQSLKLGD